MEASIRSRKRRAWAALAGLGLLVLAGVLLGTRQPSLEPVYEGRRYTEWLEAAPGDDPANLAAQAALRAIGTNALPFLLRELAYEDSAPAAWVARKLRGFNLISIGLEPWWNDERKRDYRARLGLAWLSRSGLDLSEVFFSRLSEPGRPGWVAAEQFAAFATPERLLESGHLIRLVRMKSTVDPELQQKVSVVLERLIGTSDVTHLSTLKSRFVEHDPGPWRGNTIVALTNPELPAAETLPLLTNQLSNTNSLVRWLAAAALGKLGSNAVVAIPALHQARERENSQPRGVTSLLDPIQKPPSEVIARIEASLRQIESSAPK